MSIKNPAAVALGKKRWEKKSKKERREHALKMVAARKLQVKHLPSDYPPSDEALMDAQADAEAKHGEIRSVTE